MIIRKKEQVSVLNELTTVLSNFENIHKHDVIFAGDFNIFFNASLDAKGDTPTLKSQSIDKLIELWKIRNLKKRKYTCSTKTFIWSYSTKIRLHCHITKSPRIC